MLSVCQHCWLLTDTQPSTDISHIITRSLHTPITVIVLPALSLQSAVDLVGLLVCRGRGVVNICGRMAPAAEEQAAHWAFKHVERVVQRKHLSDEIKVDEEQHDSKVDERERRRHEEHATHLKDEHQRYYQTRLQLTGQTNRHMAHCGTNPKTNPLILTVALNITLTH